MTLFPETVEPQTIIITNKNHNVMNKKTYENPESELITIRFEGNFCQSPYGSKNSAGTDLTEDDEHTYSY